jgi:NitT/TauT family transport system ATP-binding protein
VVAMSPRPGRIARVIEIDLVRPRTIAMEFSERFKTYSEQVREVIYHG